MMTSTILSLLAASAAAWTIDLRNVYEENHTVYIKAGETLDFLLDGYDGTGYRWVNNIAFAQQNNENIGGHINFIEETKLSDDRLDFGGFLNDDEEESSSKIIENVQMGGMTNFRHSFQTVEDVDFDEVITFVHERPWMMNNEFPETRFDTQGGYFSQVNVKAMASFAVDLSSDNFSLESLPDNIDIQ